MIDLSHLNEKGFDDVARLSDAPLVATHSNAHAVTPSTRNLTDRQLATIRESGGMVGLNYATVFLREDGRKSTDCGWDPVMRHLDHLIDKLGEDHVGFGSDFDGAEVPDVIGDVTGVQALIGQMRERQYGEELIKKIACKNWICLLEIDVEADVGEGRGDHLGAAVVAVLAHLGDQHAGRRPCRLLKASVMRRDRVKPSASSANLPFVDAGNGFDLGPVAAEHLFHRVEISPTVAPPAPHRRQASRLPLPEPPLGSARRAPHRCLGRASRIFFSRAICCSRTLRRCRPSRMSIGLVALRLVTC
jgi:hypothetical protein